MNIKPQHILGGALALAISIGAAGYALTHKDMTGSSWEAIEAYRAEHPMVNVSYDVTITGGSEPLMLNERSVAVALTHDKQMDNLAEMRDYLQGLVTIDLTALVPSPEQLLRLQDCFPNAEILLGELELLGKLVPADSTTLSLPALSADEFAQAANQLLCFPQLTDVTIADGDIPYTHEPVALLAEAIPNVAVHMNFELFGQSVSTDMEKIEYFKAEIGDEGLNVFRTIMPIMHKLSYLKLDWCGTTDQATAALRDELADRCKVVWRVFFADFNALTDTYKIWAQYYVWSRDLEPLKYCTEVRYIDMGHSYIDSCEFVRYMPHLNTLIIADNTIKDIEPLRSCKELTYLEIFTTNVEDLSPLAELTKLEYLNISNIETRDITPLYGLTGLKKMNSTMNPQIPKEQIEEFKQRLPDCDATFTFFDESPTEYGWRRAPSPPDGMYRYTPRYALLRQQIGYDTKDYSRYPKGYLTEEVTYESTGILPPEEYYKEENYAK